MFYRRNLVGYIVFIFLSFSWWSYRVASSSIDYKTALTKSLLYYEAQRSGKLPYQRVQWRGDSGLQDGTDVNMDLAGGYYDAGDNVKFGFPMAFTMTMLSWGVIEFGQQLNNTNELSNALDAIRWGTDYLMKAHPEPNVLYGEVGDGDSDHECWQRPEDMTTPRLSHKITVENAGSDLAAETAAALAAATIVFRTIDSNYADQLLGHAIQLFDFAKEHHGLYHWSITEATKYYPSSGYWDELLWASAWLFRATSTEDYISFLDPPNREVDTGGVRSSFSWDDKYVGVQIYVAKLVLDEVVPFDMAPWKKYKDEGEAFICKCLQKFGDNIKKTPGGLLWFQASGNLQYTTLAAFVAVFYHDSLKARNARMKCNGTIIDNSELIAFAQSQVDYILGFNSNGMSYMVGFGSKFPTQVHHRGASIVSIKKDPTPVTCKGGFDLWYNKNEPNPNVLDGAIVGGPDENDTYTDSRSNYQMAGPAIVNTAPLVGVLAWLASRLG